MDLWVIYPSGRLSTAKARAFVQWFEEILGRATWRPAPTNFRRGNPSGLCSPRQHPVWNQLIARPAFSSR